MISLKSTVTSPLAIVLCASAILGLGPSVSWSGDKVKSASFSQPGRSHPNLVRVQASVEGHRIVRGKPFEVRLYVTIEKGYHINSNRPRDKFLIPTQVMIKNTPDFTFMPAKFPPALDRKLEFSEEKLLVFEGEVQFEVHALGNIRASLGRKTLSGSLKYQACDESTCYPPRTVPFEIEVEVVQ
jgi:thioredoxin:protein disulfide reductase